MKQSVNRSSALLLAQRLCAIVILLLIWQAGVWSGAFPRTVPSVFSVIGSIFTLLASPLFWVSLGQTMGSALAGWAIGAVVGILLGLVIGTIPFVQRSTIVVIEFARSFPLVALLPVVVLTLGANFRMEIFMVALSCVWPIMFQTIYGSRRQDPAVVDTVRVFRIPGLLRFRRVLLPSSLPFVTTGLRVASSIAVLVAVATEILTQTPGIGRQITLAQDAARWDVALAYLFFAGLVGYFIATGLAALERRSLRWNRRRED